MFASILTTILFAISALSSSRAARAIGPIHASVVRLGIAVIVLGVYAFSFGQGLAGPGLPAYLVSGLVGFGIGDIALFHAYESLGARLGILLAQVLAVPFSALIEWLWLGTVLTRELTWIILVLLGICLALSPSKRELARGVTSWRGIVFGIIAALGQAGGAVLSRKAILLNEAAHIHVNGPTASFQRIMAGTAISAGILLVVKQRRRPEPECSIPAVPVAERSRVASLCLANAISGPILGVSCYQWALSSAPSGVVLAIVATTPIVILPMAWLLEKDRPGLWSLAGSFLAVAGVIGLLIE